MLTITVVLLVVGLVGLHLAGIIFGNDGLLVGDELVSKVITPAQSGFSSIVDWVVDRLYQLKLYSRLELEYNNLRQENEQLVYRAMLADELQYKLSVYEFGKSLTDLFAHFSCLSLWERCRRRRRRGDAPSCTLSVSFADSSPKGRAKA